MLAFSNDYYGIIFRATQSVELFCAYDYFIMNFLIRILYENVEEARNMIDKVEYNNPCLYVLNALMNKPYSNKEWDMLRSETDFFKLSWKEQYIQESVDEQMTYYEKLSVISHI